jgi:hypothetical protein
MILNYSKNNMPPGIPFFIRKYFKFLMTGFIKTFLFGRLTTFLTAIKPKKSTNIVQNAQKSSL